MSNTNPAQREYAYNDPETPWDFQSLDPKDSIRNCAIFVVHGMGTQLYSETAKTLRDGFETALADIRDDTYEEKLKAYKKHKDKKRKPRLKKTLPPPYVFEGYWADYPDIEATFPEKWRKFSKYEGIFFNSLAKVRITDPNKNASWFVGQVFRILCPWKSKKIPIRNRLAFILLAPIITFVVLFMLTIKPKVYADVLSDVKIYCDPQGSFEKAIVQRIDKRVGKRLLALLGLDWNLQSLPPSKQVRICSKPHTFKYVTVMAHSLGSVIAYNVIGDILQRTDDFDMYINKKKKPPPGLKLPPQANIQRVRTGLHRFNTMGSPLHLINILFNHRIGKWPDSSKNMFIRQNRQGEVKRKWWCNFHHVCDPISSPMTKSFPEAINLHSKCSHLPGGAHSSYFKDKDVLQHIISRTYGFGRCDLREYDGKKDKWKKPEFLPKWQQNLYNVLLALLYIVVLAVLAALVILWGISRIYYYGNLAITWVKSFLVGS